MEKKRWQGQLVGPDRTNPTSAAFCQMTETPLKPVNVTQVVPEDHSVEVKVEVGDAEGVAEGAEEGVVKQEANYGNMTRIRVTEILQNPEEEVKVEVGF